MSVVWDTKADLAEGVCKTGWLRCMMGNSQSGKQAVVEAKSDFVIVFVFKLDVVVCAKSRYNRRARYFWISDGHYYQFQAVYD